MRRTLLTLLTGGIVLATSCFPVKRDENITPEGFPMEVNFNQDCNAGKIIIGPVRGVTIIGEDYNSDDDGELNSIAIIIPKGYAIGGNDLPKEYPLSRYANRGTLQKLYDQLKKEKCGHRR